MADPAPAGAGGQGADPGDGPLTRSAINHQSGAVTRVSGLFAAATVAGGVLLLAPFARFVPKAALAGLLIVTAARLIDWRRTAYALRASRYDAALVLITAFSAVFISVEFSILIGVALSILLFVPRAARLRATELVVAPEGVVQERHAGDTAFSDILIYDLEGEIFFGAAPELDRYHQEISDRSSEAATRFIVLRVKRTRNPDVVFLERLQHFLKESERAGVTVLLAGVRPDLAVAMRNVGFSDWFPAHRVFQEDDTTFSATLRAVRSARSLLGTAG
ncbi:MAG: SulP family inorganic anion transporter, partial [Opitutaceae bacterium]